MVRVALNRYELRVAANVGVERRLTGIAKGREAFHGAEERKNEWQIDIIGCIAEYAFAKYMDRYWLPATDGSIQALEGDVAWYQVRSTQWPDGHLFVHDYDSDEVPFVLAVVTDRYVDLIGWITGAGGKEAGKPKPAGRHTTYWVPQHSLRDMEELPSNRI